MNTLTQKIKQGFEKMSINEKTQNDNELEIKTSDLKRILSNAIKLVSKTTTIPVLSNIDIKLVNSGRALCFTVYDLESYYIDYAEVQCTYGGSFSALANGESIAAPAAVLHKIVSNEKADYVYLSINNDSLPVLTIKGKRDYKVECLPGAEFPKMRSVEYIDKSYTINPAALQYVSKAASTDQTRYVLNGVLFTGRENTAAAIVATDGRRLHLHEHNAIELNADYILPIKAIKMALTMAAGNGKKAARLELLHSADYTTITLLDETGLDNKTTIICRHVEGTYPNYRQVVPAKFEYFQPIPDAEKIRGFCDSWKKLCGGINTVKYKTGVLSAKSSEGFTMEEDVITSLHAEVSPEIAFNPVYLSEALQKNSTCSHLKFNDEFKPVIIQNELFMAVIMPMRG